MLALPTDLLWRALPADAMIVASQGPVRPASPWRWLHLPRLQQQRRQRGPQPASVSQQQQQQRRQPSVGRRSVTPAGGACSRRIRWHALRHHIRLVGVTVLAFVFFTSCVCTYVSVLCRKSYVYCGYLCLILLFCVSVAPGHGPLPASSQALMAWTAAEMSRGLPSTSPPRMAAGLFALTASQPPPPLQEQQPQPQPQPAMMQRRRSSSTGRGAGGSVTERLYAQHTYSSSRKGTTPIVGAHHIRTGAASPERRRPADSADTQEFSDAAAARRGITAMAPAICRRGLAIRPSTIPRCRLRLVLKWRAQGRSRRLVSLRRHAVTHTVRVRAIVRHRLLLCQCGVVLRLRLVCLSDRVLSVSRRVRGLLRWLRCRIRTQCSLHASRY